MASLDVSSTKFNPDTGMTDEARTKVAEHLGRVLADSYILFIQTQGVHWNVTGPLFVSVHELTEAHYGNIYEAIDEIAERIRALGLKAPASYRKYGELSDIEDGDPNPEASVEEQLELLIKGHQTVVKTMRSAIEPCEEQRDFVTADMLIDRMSWHEEAIWMLRSIIAK